MSLESETAMDELDEEDANGEDVDVAALMGFGSFGDQHRGKRRRYNSRTDGAVVDGSQPGPDTGKGKGRGNNGNGSGSGSGSGSNNLPLGTGRSRPRPRPKKGGGANAAENEGSGNAESSIDAASSLDQPAPPPMPALTPLPPPATGGDTSLPPKPPLPSLPHSSGKAQAPTSIGTGKGPENEAWKWRKGVRLANGDVAYYDASFVEDPWRGLR